MAGRNSRKTVVFLDEPTTGLHPHARRNLWEIITKMKSDNRTVILTTDYMEEAERLCDRIAILLFLPMIFLSGVYFSVDGIPKFLKPFVEFLPLTHLVRAIRAIFNHGVSLFNVLPQLGVLTV